MSHHVATKSFVDNYFYCLMSLGVVIWGIERSGFFNGQGKWAKGFENQMV